jgi:hypothetical protein
MHKAWNGFIAFAAIINACTDAMHWYRGDTATGITWSFAILFSLTVFAEAIGEFRKAKP